MQGYLFYSTFDQTGGLQRLSRLRLHTSSGFCCIGEQKHLKWSGCQDQI